MAHLVAVHNIKGLAYVLMSQTAIEIVMGLVYFKVKADTESTNSWHDKLTLHKAQVNGLLKDEPHFM